MKRFLKNEQFLDRIFENSSAGETISDLNGKWLRVNKAFCTMIGYTEEEIYELDFSQLTHKDDREKDIAVFEKFMRGKNDSARLEKRFIHKDGHSVFVSLVATSVKNNEGEIEFFYTQFQDLTNLHQTKENMATAESLLHAFTKNVPAITTLRSLDGKYVLVNSELEKILNMPSTSIIGKCVGDIWPADFAAEIEELQNRTLALKESDSKVIKYDNGWLLVTMFPLHNQHGEIHLLGEMVLDISKQKSLEDALIESEERFSLASKASKDGVFDADIGRNQVWYSENLYTMLGHENNDHVANTNTFFDELVHPEDKERVVAQYRSQIANGEQIRFDCRIRKRDGGLLWVEFRADSTKDKQGKLKRVIGSISDISIRKEAELQRHMIFDAATCGMIMVTEAGTVIQMNSMMTQLFGYAESELLGKPVEMLIPQRNRGVHEHNRSTFYASPTSRAMGRDTDLYGLRKDGTEFLVDIGLNPVQFNGETRVIATIVDITTQKRTESELQHRAQELERSNNELEQFAYVASHDLQEPLRMVASFTELLAARYKNELDDRAQEYISFASDGAKRMQVLINDLLQYSRVGSKSQDFSFVDCNLICRNLIIKDLSIAISDSNANIVINQLPKLSADEGQLRQLFQNLIGNAMKYVADNANPKIEVSALEDDDNWQFSIRDNGIGIDQQYHSRIFVIFQRLHGKSEFSGTGIGLAICKKIVERHGGRIWVESSPDQGSDFKFTIAKNVYS